MSDKGIPITRSVGYEIVQWKSQNLSKKAEKTSTENAPKLETGPKISNFRKAIINFKAALSSVPPGRKFDSIKQKMTESEKTQLNNKKLDRQDRVALKSNENIKGIKPFGLSKARGNPVPGNKHVAPKFGIQFSSLDFPSNAKIILSTHFDKLISDTKWHPIDGDKGIRKEIREAFKLCCPFASKAEVAAFKREDLLQVAESFRNEGRSLKADILTDLVEEFTNAHSFATLDKKFGDKVGAVITKQVSGVLKDIQLNRPAGEDFLRGEDVTEMDAILFSCGGRELQSGVDTSITLAINEKVLEGVGNYDMKDRHSVEGMQKTVDAALFFLDQFDKIEPDDKMIKKLQEFSQHIDVHKEELGQDIRNKLMHRFFNNNVILRNLTPALTVVVKQDQIPARRELMAVGKLLTTIANNAGGDEKKVPNPQTRQTYGELCAPVWNKMNDILAKYGMPVECKEIPLRY